MGAMMDPATLTRLAAHTEWLGELIARLRHPAGAKVVTLRTSVVAHVVPRLKMLRADLEELRRRE